MSRPIVVGVTGASGAVYARRLLEVLLSGGHQVHLVVSPSGSQVFLQELGIQLNLQRFEPGCLGEKVEAFAENLHFHSYGDFMAPIASGSHLTQGMVICPCSGTTLSGVVTGSSANLIQRAAEVHLKERRKLILVPRETPLSLVQIENLRTATLAGAVVLPASPGWYHGVESLDDLVNFVVARILDQLQLPSDLIRRWGAESE